MRLPRALISSTSRLVPRFASPRPFSTTTAGAMADKPASADRALPAPGDESAMPTLDISGGEGNLKLDALGPLVVNTDGTVARIGNWAQMNEIERNNTLRVLGKRNQQRLAALRSEAAAKEGGETTTTTSKEGETKS